MIFADKDGKVYAYDPVIDYPAQVLIKSMHNVTAIAGDNRKSKLFIADYQESRDEATVYEYDYFANVRNLSTPTIQLNFTSVKTPYKGGMVSSMFVDKEHHLLIIGDSKEGKIVEYNYEPVNDTVQPKRNLYAGVKEMKNLGVIANHGSKLYWTNTQEGKTLGTLGQANMKGWTNSTKILTKEYDGALGLSYYEHCLYFTTSDGKSVYKYNLEWKNATLISSEFTKATRVQVLDGAIFVEEEGVGLSVMLPQYKDGKKTYKPPKKVELNGISTMHSLFFLVQSAYGLLVGAAALLALIFIY